TSFVGCSHSKHKRRRTEKETTSSRYGNMLAANERNCVMKIPWYLRHKPAVALVVGLGGLVTTIDLAGAKPWGVGGGPPGPYQAWQTIAASADGARLVAAAGQISSGYGYGGGYYYPVFPFMLITSRDGGSTWIPTTAPTNLWQAVASSADGGKLVAV